MAQNKPTIPRELRLLYWNANGLYIQHLTFKQFLHDHQIDIGLLNETHLKQYHKLKIRNYDIFRIDRLGLKGGTGILIKTHLPYEPFNLPNFQTIEACGIRLFTQTSSIALVAVYKQPKVYMQLTYRNYST